jgi:hypothetical protein
LHLNDLGNVLNDNNVQSPNLIDNVCIENITTYLRILIANNFKHFPSIQLSSNFYHRPALQTVSNALLKSTKQQKSFFPQPRYNEIKLCSMKVLSQVECPLLKVFKCLRKILNDNNVQSLNHCSAE